MSLAVTRQDVPYVAFVALSAAVIFLAGRWSAPPINPSATSVMGRQAAPTIVVVSASSADVPAPTAIASSVLAVPPLLPAVTAPLAQPPLISRLSPVAPPPETSARTTGPVPPEPVTLDEEAPVPPNPYRAVNDHVAGQVGAKDEQFPINPTKAPQ